jgi:hypothetical protein
VAPDNGSLTPTTARRILYAIVAACAAVTGAAALLRPAPPPATGPQRSVLISPRSPVVVPEGSMPNRAVSVPPSGLSAQSVRMGIVSATVHGLPGQVGASP